MPTVIRRAPRNYLVIEVVESPKTRSFGYEFYPSSEYEKRGFSNGSPLRPTARDPSSSITCLLHIDELIGATACGDDVEHGKPDPRIVDMALRKLGLSGSEAVMIGDTPYEPAQDAHQSEYFRNSNCFKQLVFITME